MTDSAEIVRRLRDAAEGRRYGVTSDLINEAAAHIEALEARAEAEWLPIESAPISETYLATCFDTSCGEWVVTLLNGVPGRRAPWTHWRPLPAPPATEPQDG